MKTRNEMNMDHALVFASELGGKLHSGFLKLFSGEIEEDEIVKNQPEPGPESQHKVERFLDRT